MNILLYSDDINLLTHWEKALQRDVTVVETIQELYVRKNSIIILNYSACEAGCIETIKKLNTLYNRVLVLHRTPSFEVAKELLQVGAFGYGNALMQGHFIVSAMNAIEAGMVWLYPQYTSQLILSMDEQPGKDISKVLAPLSEREKETALLIKEGLTYKEIGDKLEITSRTVKAHAQKIFTKLNVKDRVALALLLK